MFYIVPLGNPGDSYAHTRHNVAWQILDRCIAQWGLSQPVAKSAYAGRYTSGRVDGSEVFVLYPDTYMNHSGVAVRKTVPSKDIQNTIVVYDDVDMPLGAIKLSVGRGSGGHNGVTSIITELGTKDFLRVRVGIAPTNAETGEPVRPSGDRLASFVLGKFSTREEEEVAACAVRVQAMLELIMSGGPTVAMNKFN